MSLSDVKVKKAISKEKRYMLCDGRGLYLEVMPSGIKSWRFRCQQDGKAKKITIGTYPEISLGEARIKTEELRSNISHGIPLTDTKTRTFEEIANEWLKIRMKPVCTERHIEIIEGRLKRHIFPYLGEKTIKEITPLDILAICRRLETAGTIETAHRVKQIIGQICRYAISICETTTDPTYSLQNALQSRIPEHRATITNPDDIAVLMRLIAEYPRIVMRFAMQFSALTFARPGEIRCAEWSEISIEKQEWKIPAEKMKMRRVHIVPLATQTIEILNKLKIITGSNKWLFPSIRMDGRCMSADSVRMALRSMGYGAKEITPHGFRAMASTILNEHKFSADMIELQLAHAPSSMNPIRAAYNHAQYLSERHKMMQWWADFLMPPTRVEPSFC